MHVRPAGPHPGRTGRYRRPSARRRGHGHAAAVGPVGWVGTGSGRAQPGATFRPAGRPGPCCRNVGTIDPGRPYPGQGLGHRSRRQPGGNLATDSDLCSAPVRRAGWPGGIPDRQPLPAIPRPIGGCTAPPRLDWNTWALSWALETAQTQLRINLYDPGPVATRLRATAMPGEDPRGLPQPAMVAAGLVRLCLSSETRHGSCVTYDAEMSGAA